MSKILIALAATLLAGLALAQGPRFSTAEAPREGMTARMQSEPFTLRRQHGPSGLGVRMRGALHETLGLSEEEIHARKETGASIASIAEEEGISRGELEAAYLDARSDAIEELVREGLIDAFRAERMEGRGLEVFASIADRPGLGGGQHATGTPLEAQRTQVPRGPRAAQAEPIRQQQMEPMRHGHGRRTD
jgi:hypothetical protein